ncbi:MAG: Zn-ribbon domain-containing OB-fold protein [Acidimicrobiales bacterium]
MNLDPLLHPVDDAVVAVGKGVVTLVGGRCRTCTRVHFPLQACCPTCGGIAEKANLPSAGKVHAVTVTALPVPGAPSPTRIAMVQLCADVIVQGVLQAPVAIDDIVHVVGREIAGPDGPLLGFAFAPGCGDA